MTTNAHATTPAKPIHATHEFGTPSLCQAVRETTEDNSTELFGEVTCKRCLKALEGLNKTVDTTIADTPDEVPEPMATVSKAPKAEKAPKPVKEPKAEKAPKAATIHYHDIDRHPVYQTWCKIPGQHSPDAADVTCKVCRAHLDGKAPLNAIPDRVKAARKAFRSFVARVAYMVYMDADNTDTEWLLNHTNMAGTEYAVSWSRTLGYRVMEDDEITITDMGKDIKVWMEDNWSCGEDK